MALRYIDSFDHYQTTDITRRWTTTVGPPTIAEGAGRCGTNALNISVSTSCAKGIAASGTTLVCGFAFKLNSSALGSFFSELTILSMGTGSNTHVTLKRSWADGSLVLYRTGVTTTAILTTDPDLIRVGNWYFIEIKVDLHVSAGTAEIRVNGVSAESTSGIKTLGADAGGDFTDSWTFVGFSESNVSDYYVDDLYVLDAATTDVDGNTTTRTDFLGDCTVEYLQPSADGATIDWDLTGSGSRWNVIDDGSAPDGDTDYISTATLNEINLAEYHNPVLQSGTVYGVQVVMDCVKADSGDRTIAAVVRSSDTNAVGPDKAVSETDYHFEHTIFDTNPVSDADWTVEDVNGAQFGVKLTT